MNNCLFYVLLKYLKFGGYIIIRRSKFGFWYHFMWSKDLREIEDYIPIDRPLKFPLFTKILFRGEVRKRIIGGRNRRENTVEKNN